MCHAGGGSSSHQRNQRGSSASGRAGTPPLTTQAAASKTSSAQPASTSGGAAAAASSSSASNHVADHPSLPDSDDLLGMTAHTPGDMLAAALASSTADLAALTSSSRVPPGAIPLRPPGRYNARSSPYSIHQGADENSGQMAEWASCHQIQIVTLLLGRIGLLIRRVRPGWDKLST